MASRHPEYWGIASGKLLPVPRYSSCRNHILVQTLNGTAPNRTTEALPHNPIICPSDIMRPSIFFPGTGPGPMTELLAQIDAYTQEFTATVIDVVEGGVVLDRTAFYTGGGGQPCDTGTLNDGSQCYAVKRVARADGQIVHQIDGPLPAQGASVTGQIDWDTRYRLMRTHTALHILCGVVWRDYGAKVTGGDMRPGEARMDFELEQMSAEFASEVEEKVNAEVAAARPIHVHVLSRSEAEEVPDLVRTKINLLPANIQEVRTIDITGLDMQADGGTHVANTSEVGSIRVVGHESKGRINKRLRIALAE